MEPKILINGKEVQNLNDLPEGVRNLLSDDNGNGIPDIAENPFAMFGKLGDLKGLMQSMPDLQKGLPQIIQKIQQGGQSININGKEYNSLADITESDKAELKAQLSQMQHLDSASTEKQASASQQASQQAVNNSQMLSRTPLTKRSEIPVTDSPVIQEKQDKNRVVIFILGLLALAGYIIVQYFIGA